MPAGDAQTRWFPEMIEVLRARWNIGLAFAALIELTTELDTMPQRIRASGTPVLPSLNARGVDMLAKLPSPASLFVP